MKISSHWICRYNWDTIRFSNVATRNFGNAVIKPFPPSDLRPFKWVDRSEPLFNPKIHLENGGVWDFTKIACHGLPDQAKFGFTEPFKVLSDEGLNITKSILDIEKENGFIKPDRRIQLCLRGATYRSPFLRSFSECHELTTLASTLSGEPLIIHPIISNHSHVNWGLPAEETGEIKSVDQWHQDSVSHVLIILLSDMSRSIGGDLELLMKPTDEGFKLLHDTNNNVPNNLIHKIQFPGPGYGVFVTGSELLHRVTPLIKSAFPRITLIQSFASADPWISIDRTKWEYYSKAVSAEWAGYEWMHYHSWKLGSQLLSLPQRIPWGPDTNTIASELRRISNALTLAADQIEQKVEEPKLYFDESHSSSKTKHDV